MRRITTNYIGYWSLGFRQPITNATVIDRRDYRLLLRVARAAHELEQCELNDSPDMPQKIRALCEASHALNKRSTKP